MKRLLPHLVVALISVSRLVAQDSTSNALPASTDRPYRDPATARTLAMILPGAGHVYSGEYLQAYGYWVGTAVGISVGVALFDEPCSVTSLVGVCGERWTRVTSIALVSLGLYTWIRSVRDAPRAAERANTRHNKRVIAPLLRPPAEGRSGWRAGVAIDW